MYNLCKDTKREQLDRKIISTEVAIGTQLILISIIKKGDMSLNFLNYLFLTHDKTTRETVRHRSFRTSITRKKGLYRTVVVSWRGLNVTLSTWL